MRTKRDTPRFSHLSLSEFDTSATDDEDKRKKNHGEFFRNQPDFLDYRQRLRSAKHPTYPSEERLDPPRGEILRDYQRWEPRGRDTQTLTRQWSRRQSCPAVDIFVKSVTKDFEKLISSNKSNITPNEKKALKEIKDWEDVILNPSDKGGNTVIWPVTMYIDEAERQLNNKHCYERLFGDPTDDFVQMYDNMIKEVHKDQNKPPGRPIISGNVSLGEKASQFLDSKLRAFVINLPSYVRDTMDVVNKLDGILLSTSTLLVTCDVESLYTSIDHKAGFIDDIFIIWNDTVHNLEKFIETLNNNTLNLKLTHIIDSNRIDFLDITIIKNDEGKTENNCKAVKEPNSVLVFLPGLFEINFMHELFSNMVHKRLHVYPLHSSITLDEQNFVFMTPVLGYRKIILSTNIAESSITVPDVKYVIDFCLTKTLVCDEETNYQSLRLCWASKTNCDQRKGRAGRVSKGYCYRLVMKEFYDNYIPENVVPEMLRSPLGSTVLKVKLLDMGEPRALLATALSPPHISDIERTILLLKEVGALAVSKNREDENPYDGELTFLGKVLAHLPVDLQLGKLIVLGHVFGCLDECLIIAAALSLQNFFAMPYKHHMDGYRNKLSFSGNSGSDSIALVDAFKSWLACKERGELRLSKDELEWGKSNYFQIRRIREVAALYEELKKRVSQFNMHVTKRPAMDSEYEYKQRFIFQIVMAGAFYPNYFTFAQSEEEMAVKELGGKDPKTTVMLKNIPPYGFLYHKQIQSLFRQCGQVKSILFDGSKAFVEFSRNPMERFRTLSAVYLALKMAKIKVPLSLNIHSAEEVEEASEGATTSLKHTRVNVDFRKQTVDSVHVSQTFKEHLETIKGLILSINVTEVVEVGHFWGFRIDEQNMHILGNLTTEINRHHLMPLAEWPRPDLMCLAPFTDLENQRYYRAQILYIHGDVAEVFFVDYGNQSTVKLNLLREIPGHLLDLPFQALEFNICKMRPSAKSIIFGGHWSRAASERFASLVNGCALVVKVYSIVHGILHVDVYRHFENLEDISIRELLISDGYAEPAEESYESNIDPDAAEGIFLWQS
ncbi:ATP-dependent RNA helicase TDRD9 [Discoglossus pictus]